MSCKSFCITREDFELAIKQLTTICDQWSIMTVTLRGDNKETLYLSQRIQRPSVKLPCETDTTAVNSQEVDLEDNDTAVLNVTNVPLICYHYSMVYSESYQVPVMYFTASWQDGRQLQLQQVWDQIPLTSDVADKLSTLTQTEHPLLGIPCYHVHPCNTATMMSSVLDDKVEGSHVLNWQTRYLIMWLSLVGPIINLPLSTSLLRIGKVKHPSGVVNM